VNRGKKIEKKKEKTDPGENGNSNCKEKLAAARKQKRKRVLGGEGMVMAAGVKNGVCKIEAEPPVRNR